MEKDITFSELFEELKRIAHYMQILGVEKGGRVVIMLPNSPQSVIGYYGALFAGATVVQTNPLYTERELEYQLKDSGAKLIICLDILLPRVTNIRGNTDIEHTIVTAIKDYLPLDRKSVV